VAASNKNKKELFLHRLGCSNLAKNVVTRIFQGKTPGKNVRKIRSSLEIPVEHQRKRPGRRGVIWGEVEKEFLQTTVYCIWSVISSN